MKVERPLVLSILCVVVFLSVPTAAISAALRHAGSPLQLALGLAGSAAALAGFAGVWLMRRWGVWVYAVAVSFNVAILASSGGARWPHFAVPIGIMAVLLFYYGRMA